MRYKGQWGEAEKVLREALAIIRRLAGEESLGVGGTLFTLAAVQYEKGEWDEAEGMYRESLAIDRKLLGNEHPNLGSDLLNLGVTLLAKGELDEAERLCREALARRRKSLGDEHPEVAVCLAGLGEVLLAKGDIQGAVKLARQALAFPEDKVPVDSKVRARANSLLGAALSQQEKYQEAEPLLLHAYKVLSVQQPGSRRTRTALQRVIDLYKAWGKPEKAAEYQKLAVNPN